MGKKSETSSGTKTVVEGVKPTVVMDWRNSVYQYHEHWGHSESTVGKMITVHAPKPAFFLQYLQWSLGHHQK